MILNANDLWRPDPARDHVLTVHVGCLWATQSRRRDDVILRAGETLELTGAGWLVQSLGAKPCEFSTSAAETSSPFNPVVDGLFRTLESSRS